jgi:hypothetical protein
MNYDLLDKLIPPRRLPDEPAAARQKLWSMFRSLETLREARTNAVLEAERAELDRQIEFYEDVLEGS